MSYMNPEETLALGHAQFLIACASMPELGDLNRALPDLAKKIWIHGWLMGRSNAFEESARMYEEVRK